MITKIKLRRVRGSDYQRYDGIKQQMYQLYTKEKRLFSVWRFRDTFYAAGPNDAEEKAHQRVMNLVRPAELGPEEWEFPFEEEA